MKVVCIEQKPTAEQVGAIEQSAAAANEAASIASLALAELGTMTATGMESTAELGATVAALEARITALESAAKAKKRQ